MSKQPSPRPSRLPWIIVGVLVLAGAGAGVWYWRSAGTAPAQTAEAGTGTVAAGPQKPAMYFALDPAFVVNLADTDAVRYLQLEVQLMTRDAATAAAMQLHAPAIRNRLLLLFGQHSAAQLAQRSAKERLQEQTRDEAHAVLAAEGAPAAVEAAYFTSFVTQ